MVKQIVFTLLTLMTLCAAQDILKPIIEIENIGSKEALGSGVMGVGDINGDGWPDVAVSARDIGKTYLYFGGPGILDNKPDVILRGGGKIAKGDLNGDGRMDLVIAGKDTLYVFLGKSGTGLKIDTIPNFTFIGEASVGTTYFGNSIAVGDLNSDGFDDVIVGASGFQNKGKIYFYMGKHLLSNVPEYVALGDTLGEGYGFKVNMSDINGDNMLDLVVGSLRYISSDNSYLTNISVYLGKKNWTFQKNDLSYQISSNDLHMRLLYTYELGDYNLDGLADISCTDDSSVYLFYGRSDSIRWNYDFKLSPSEAAYPFSSGAIGIGDINNDGKNDFAFRAWPGGAAVCIYAFLGSAKLQTIRVAGLCRSFVSDGFNQICGVGDMNGDGVNDFAAGAPYNPLVGSSPQDGYFVIFSGDKNWVTAIGEENNLPPTNFTLSQNYPNPFNPTTKIEYTLEDNGFVTLKIYDAIGREVTTLVCEEQYKGLHNAVWSGRNSVGEFVGSGNYFYQLQINNRILTKKAVFIR